MLKKDHLKVAQMCFNYMEKAKVKHGIGNVAFWETYMYESLFAWAGWKE